MAITAEQASAIATAIDNLNKSVQVNEEVLQIVKSMQSTGAAGSIAEHDADLNAHPKFNELLAAKAIAVNTKQKDFNKSTKSYANLTALENGEFGNSVLDLFARINQSEQGVYNAVRFNQNFINERIGRTQCGVVSSRRFTESDGIFRTTHNISFGISDKGPEVYIGLNQSELGDSSSNSQYFFRYDGFLPSISVDLGSTTYQWKDLYLKNSPTVSSDRRLKQDFSAVPEAVFKAWEKVNFCQYKFKEAVEKKGAEARLHVGLVAQEILEAFEAQGLDATKYGIVCHDSWEDQYQEVEVGTKPAILNEKGEVVTPEEPIMEHQLIKKAGDLWTVRYEEALALEAAYQRWKLQKIEAALAEKGISL